MIVEEEADEEKEEKEMLKIFSRFAQQLQYSGICNFLILFYS